MGSTPADSAAWLVEVFKCKHQSKYGGKGGKDTHRQARPSLLPSMHPPQHGRRHQGGRGGIGHRLRSRLHGSSLSGILLANVQTLDGELNGLHARVGFHCDAGNCGVLCLTKAWLEPGVLDSTIQPGGGHWSWPCTSACWVRWTGWWCSPASASSSRWCWGSGRSVAVLRRCAARRDSRVGRGLRLLAGAQRVPALLDLRGPAALHPRGHRHGHHEQQLLGFRFSLLWSRRRYRIHQASTERLRKSFYPQATRNLIEDTA